MALEMQAQKKEGKSTQSQVPVSEIRDGVTILNDGTMRATLMVSSVNFALKSQEEQDAIVFAYQDFLNSLDFPVQITISSRKMDITPYIESVRILRDKQQNDLLRLQMDEYIKFIEELVKGSNIMTKTFFVTIPFSVQQSRKESPVGKIFKGFKGATGKHTMTDEEFEHNRSQLMQRVNQVALGLRSFGLRLVPLQTQELLELYYTMYNPKTSRAQRLRNAAELRVAESGAAQKKTENKSN
ncbi:hypothetical protein CL628_00195 [bacterium]|nr:hypothetical protein [bacterium]